MITDIAVSKPRTTGLSHLGQAALAGRGMGTFLLAAVILINESNFRLTDSQKFSFDWQIALRLVTCALCGLYGLANFSATRDLIFRFPAAWCVIFALWATVTVPFAVDPVYSVAACCSLWCIMLFAPAVLKQLGGRRVVLILVATLSIYSVGCWIAYFFFAPLGQTPYTLPTLEVIYRMGGLNHANATGRQAALGIALLMALGLERVVRWQTLAPLLAGFAITLFYTDSRTAMAATAALALVCVRYVPATVRIGAILAGVMGIAMVSVVGGFGMDQAMTAISRTGSADELYDVSGRSSVWPFVVEKIEDRPVFGQGYGCSRFAMAEFNDTVGQDMAGYHAHNLFLNVTLQTGVFGGALLLAMLLNQGINFLRRPSVIPDMVLILIVVAGVADSDLFNPIPDSYTVLWLISLFWRPMGASLHDDADFAMEGGFQ